MTSTISNYHFRWIVALSSALFLGMFIFSLVDLVRFTIHPSHSRYNSYIVLIPFISGYLIYLKRRKISENRRLCLVGGIPLVCLGLLLYMASIQVGSSLNQTDWISSRTFSVIVCWIGGFLLLFGIRSFRIALFPLVFLVFLVPIPAVLMDNLSRFLQAASTNVSYLLFQVIGVPVLREEFTIHLPGLSMLIAPECSGMRATITLFVLSVLAGHLYLRVGWRKIVAVASIFPITIVGNSIRIVVLTLMALHVNPGFMLSDNLLHARGGWLLFGIDLILLGGIIALLRINEAEDAETSSGKFAHISPGVRN